MTKQELKERSEELYKDVVMSGSVEANLHPICAKILALRSGRYSRLDVLDDILRLCAYVDLDWDRLHPLNYERAFSEFTHDENEVALIKGITRPDKSIHRKLHFAIKYIIAWRNEQ